MCECMRARVCVCVSSREVGNLVSPSAMERVLWVGRGLRARGWGREWVRGGGWGRVRARGWGGSNGLLISGLSLYHKIPRMRPPLQPLLAGSPRRGWLLIWAIGVESRRAGEGGYFSADYHQMASIKCSNALVLSGCGRSLAPSFVLHSYLFTCYVRWPRSLRCVLDSRELLRVIAWK